MQSLLYVSASNGAGNPSLATIQSVRSPGAVTNIVNTVAGFPVNFYATMGTPRSVVDPITGETITVITEASAVDFAGVLNAGKIDIVSIAPGYTDLGSKVGDIIIVRPITEWANNLFNILNQSLNTDGTIKSTAIPNVDDYVESGGAWTILTGFNASMTAMVGFQGTNRGTLAAIASRAFTPSKDTYVDVVRNTTTNAFTLVYNEVANAAASPPLAANSFRLAKITTNASIVDGLRQLGMDTLGNRIYPQPNQIISVIRQNNTTNELKTKSVMLTGWGAMQFNSAATIAAEAVAFGFAFATIPIITVAYGGDQVSGVGVLGGGGNTVHAAGCAKHYGDTTTGFQVMIFQPQSVNWSVGNIVYYTWTAIGEVLA